MEDRVNLDKVAFAVDAGLVNRLGLELVGRAETAVSELIKNAYDADATNVEAVFRNAYEEGGVLEITDNGVGMTLEQLLKGFMTISSTDKLHHPFSIRFNRSKAGRKGIGRFATQRLGRKLTIITQTRHADEAIRLVIDWDRYELDHDITKIFHPVDLVPKTRDEGTILVIEGLRDGWTETSIRRIYRYVSDLFQPDYLSDESRKQAIASQNDNTFQVKFYETDNGTKHEVASPQRMIFDKSLAVIGGQVDSHGNASVTITSNSLGLDDTVRIINRKNGASYKFLKKIHFKSYYFIYNRAEYYTNITKLELRNVQQVAAESGGIRLYRNGFRVLPYGEPKDDWLGLDIRYAGISGQTNIPFSNNNLFGFVEIIDKQGELFQETASREGLIENQAFEELVDFCHAAFEAARIRIAEKITIIRQPVAIPGSSESDNNENDGNNTSADEQFDRVDESLNSSNADDDAKAALKSIRQKYEAVLEELSMLRILASLGLTIGEFTHEIVQFTPSIHGYINKLFETNANNPYAINILKDLKQTIDNFTAYTAYFNSTVSENTSRQVKPLDIHEIVNMFVSSINDDLLRQRTELTIEQYNHDVFTTPMHVSEWSSILYNLYTNAKKAIKRRDISGKLLIICGREEGNVYLEFLDNGDGIPEENKERIFNAFFTTSTPAGFDAPSDEKLTGTGLGLKIVRDIVQTYKGTISVIPASKDYSTCFRIEVPEATNEEKEDSNVN